MCGRYVSSSTPDEIARYFDAAEQPERALEPSWNVAPTNDVYVVLEPTAGCGIVAVHHWGLVPFWAKTPAIGNKMINARAEGSGRPRTPSSTPSASGAASCPPTGSTSGRRCRVRRPSSRTSSIGPTGSRWPSPGSGRSGAAASGRQQRLRSTTIITTTAQRDHGDHPRPDAGDLPPRRHGTSGSIRPTPTWRRSAELLVPAPSEVLTMHPVSTEVNNVRNQGPHLIDPVDPIDPGRR